MCVILKIAGDVATRTHCMHTTQSKLVALAVVHTARAVVGVRACCVIATGQHGSAASRYLLIEFIAIIFLVHFKIILTENTLS